MNFWKGFILTVVSSTALFIAWIGMKNIPPAPCHEQIVVRAKQGSIEPFFRYSDMNVTCAHPLNIVESIDSHTFVCRCPKGKP